MSRRVLSDGNAVAPTNLTVIEDFDRKTIEQLVFYIQTTKIDESRKMPPQDMLKIASAYEVGCLKTLAEGRLMSGMSIETICATLNAAALVVDVGALRKACCKFEFANHKAIRARADWQSIGDSAKAQLLKIIM